MYDTLKQAMATNLDPVIVGTTEFEHNGVTRHEIKAKKAKGKKVYRVVQYENGKYSEAV